MLRRSKNPVINAAKRPMNQYGQVNRLTSVSYTRAGFAARARNCMCVIVYCERFTIALAPRA